VVAGRERGKTGKLLKMIAEKNRATVERLHMVKRHRKGQGVQNPGGIVEKEVPLDASNVMLFNPTTEKGDRVGVKVLEDGRRVRIFRNRYFP